MNSQQIAGGYPEGNKYLGSDLDSSSWRRFGLDHSCGPWFPAGMCG